MVIASIMVPTLMPDSKQCNRCKAADKNCTVSGDATSRRKLCDRCKGLKQGCSLSDKTSHTDSIEGGSAVHSVTSVEIILLRVKRRKAYVTKYNLDTCLIVIGHRLDTDELYNICHPNMYMKHGL